MHKTMNRPKFRRTLAPRFEALERLLLLSADPVPAAVSGFVYEDLNGNAVRDPSDTPIFEELIGLSGVNEAGEFVELLTVTDSNGMFVFDALAPGTYRLTNYYASGKLAGDNALGVVTTLTGSVTTAGVLDGEDSIAELTLEAGAIGTNFAFAEIASLIKGHVYLDAGGDGLNPYEDAPMAGVRIDLFRDVNLNGKVDAADGAAVATTTSAANTGSYRFVNPGMGSFLVREKVPSGYTRTAPVFSDTNVVNVCDCGIAHGGVDFANFPKPNRNAITNISYTITGAAGTRTVTNLRGNVDQADEVTVTFTVKPGFAPELALVSYTAPSKSFNAGNASLQEVFREDSGIFSPGIHTLHVTVPNSYFQVDFVAGPVIRRFGPANSNIFFSPQGRLFSADNDGTRIAGASQISGLVYNDANGNGMFDVDELGITGVTIRLTGFDFRGDFVEVDAITGADGAYAFADLIASDAIGYTIRQLPAQESLASYLDGLESTGTGGGIAGEDEITHIVLNVNTNLSGYEFGEIYWG